MTRRACSLLVILFVMLGFGWAQSPTPTTTLPKNPKDLMLLAARVNGLGSMEQPWHLKSNYQTFDADGKPKDQGVFEAWWIGPKKYKVSFSSPHFHQTLYRNGDSRLITGDDGWVSLPETMVEHYLESPMPPEEAINGRKYSVVDAKIGDIALTCLRPLPAPHVPELPTACLNENSVAARLLSYYDDHYVEFNNIVPLGDHYVAKQISVGSSNVPIVNANVTELDFPARVTDADVAAPPSARIAPYTIASPGITAGHRTQYVFSPPPATTRSDQGTVMLEATITKNGDVNDIQVISGPREFRQAAVRNVMHWKFIPFKLNGQSVAVRIPISLKYGKLPVNGIMVY